MVELEEVRELVIEALRYIGPAFAGAGITYFFTGGAIRSKRFTTSQSVVWTSSTARCAVAWGSFEQAVR